MILKCEPFVIPPEIFIFGYLEQIIVEELQGKIDEIMKKGLGMEETRAGHSEDAGEGTEDGDASNQKENRLSMKRKEKRGSDGGKNTLKILLSILHLACLKLFSILLFSNLGKRLQASRRRGRRKPVEDSSEEEEESDDSDKGMRLGCVYCI